MSQEHPKIDPEDAVHQWFGLTYASYLVLHRSVLQSMPAEWQARFVACLHELEDTVDLEAAGEPLDTWFDVRLRGFDGRFVSDPLQDYDRGRRKLPLKR